MHYFHPDPNNPRDRMVALFTGLKEIHPDLVSVSTDENGYWVNFKEHPRMEVMEFAWGSLTRNLLTSLFAEMEEVRWSNDA